METRTTRNTTPVLIASTIWSNLPMLLLMDAAICIAAIPAALLLLFGGGILSPLLAALCVGPVWAGTMRCAGRMSRDEVVTTGDFVRSVRERAGVGVSVALVPAMVSSITLGTLAIMEARPEADWLVLPLVLDGSVLILALISAMYAYPLAETGIDGARLWTVSLAAAASRPGVLLGTVALLVLLAMSARLVPGVLPLFPAPVAVYLSIVVWSVIRSSESPGDEETGGLR